MQFTELSFAFFFPIVVAVFYLLPKKGRRVWLLLASYYFYMGWNAKYAILIFVSTLITYICGILLDKKKSKAVLVTAIVSNLGILAFFKYFYFIYDSIDGFLSLFGGSLAETSLDIVLPVGISFYTFQALGYVIDVYRGDVKVEKNFIAYALFVSFFPQLVAGPIERSSHLMGQIDGIVEKGRRVFDFDKATRGLLLMLWGYFLKLVIADRAAIMVDQIFDYYYMLDGTVLFIGALLFMIQLYCDFSSYSFIAIGAAYILEIELCPNFAAPFLSRSIGEFWRRWHISLSSWFRDYVYIPLGGSRCSKLKKYRNLFITFFVSGLWHGASWHYVLWGVIHGLLLILEDILKPLRNKINYNKTDRAIVQTTLTFVITVFTFIFFRAESISEGWYYIQRIFTNFAPWSLGALEAFTNQGLDAKDIGVLVLAIISMIFVDGYYQAKHAYFDTMIKNRSLVVQYIVAIVLILSILVFGIYGSEYDATQFIYFQF